MSRKKEDILSLGWRHVVCPLAKSADPLSWVFFAGFVAFLILAVVAKFMTDGDLHTFYVQQYPVFWYGPWLLLLISTVGPIFNLTRETNEIPLGVLIGVSVAHVLIFISISVIALTQANNTTAITTLLAATVAAGMVGIGWVVQHHSSARASRRAHTFNILMQSRLSKEFQDHVRLRSDLYTAGTEVAAEDAKLVSKSGYEARAEELKTQLEIDLSRAREEKRPEVQASHDGKLELLKRKYESLQGVKYLLNFYEFMSAGIELRELDDAMLKQTVRDIAVFLYEDTAHIRTEHRKSQPDLYSNLEKVVGTNWAKDMGRK